MESQLQDVTLALEDASSAYDRLFSDIYVVSTALPAQQPVSLFTREAAEGKIDYIERLGESLKKSNALITRILADIDGSMNISGALSSRSELEMKNVKRTLATISERAQILQNFLYHEIEHSSSLEKELSESQKMVTLLKSQRKGDRKRKFNSEQLFIKKKVGKVNRCGVCVSSSSSGTKVVLDDGSECIMNDEELQKSSWALSDECLQVYNCLKSASQAGYDLSDIIS